MNITDIFSHASQYVTENGPAIAAVTFVAGYFVDSINSSLQAKADSLLTNLNLQARGLKKPMITLIQL